MASIEDLPLEILQMILTQLNGAQVWQCRRVSRAWREAADALPDEAWRRLFIRERGDAAVDVRRARLSWRDMYRSVSLWRHVSKAQITMSKEFPSDKFPDFLLLNDGTLAAMEFNNGSVPDRIRGYADTVVYYDLNTFQEIERVKYEFVFRKYQENDTYITLVHSGDKLCLITKPNRKRFDVGIIFGDYTMCEKAVFFKNSNDIICIAKVIKENDELTVKVEEQDDLEEHPLAFCYGNENCTSDDFYILTGDGNIYRYKNKDYEVCEQLDPFSPIVPILMDYGFNWALPNIFTWLTNSFPKEALGITKLEVSSAYRHGKAIFLAIENKIHIYLDAYSDKFCLGSYKRKPDKVIDLKKLSSAIFYIVQKMTVLERTNGHRIIISSCEERKSDETTKNRLYVLDLIYNEDMFKKNNRKTPSVSLKKLKKNTKKQQTKHKYKTRSSVKK